MTLKEKIRNNPIIETLLTLKGNPRVVIYSEPLWIIPFNLYAPFAAVYMSALMLTDRQIGLVASIFMFSRAISALLSGAVTDKLGRKLATFIFDTISWSIPTLLWAFSQNFWWFAVAAAFNGLMQIPDVSWTCLLVEDAEKSLLIKIYSLLHMIAQTAVVFAPLAAIMVDNLSIVPAVRILYIITFVSMTIKFILLYKYSHETEVGKTRLHETSGMSLWQIMSGYGDIFKRLFASRDMILSLTITTFFSITGMITTNFFGLYVTGSLLIPTHLLAYFPILRSFVIAGFLFFLQPRLEKFGFRNPLLIGLFIFAASVLLLISTPADTLYVLLIFIFLDAVAFSFVVPRSDSLAQLLIEPSERARIRGLMMVIVLGFSIPFGYLAGLLSEVDRRYPFVLIVALIVIMFIIIFGNKKRLAAIGKAVAEES